MRKGNNVKNFFLVYGNSYNSCEEQRGKREHRFLGDSFDEDTTTAFAGLQIHTLFKPS